MISPPDFERFFKQVKEALPQGMLDLQQDLEKNLRAALESALHRMNVVTREDFDVQADFAHRTRERLESLERRVDTLESAQPPKNSDNSDSAE
jgi:BMFP domain-containing protein YqiC